MEDRRIRPGSPTAAARIGLFGKLPARGDFVRAGLPGSFVAPWDDWLSGVVAASRDRMGKDWLAAWLEAPVWRFALPPGLCGPDAVLGVMLPSVDRVGRYFPLTLAAVLSGGRVATSEAWLDAAEAQGRAALEDDATPEQIMHALPPPALVAEPPVAGGWWTAGGPRVAPVRLALAELPDAARFAFMLGAPADAITEIGA